MSSLDIEKDKDILVDAIHFLYLKGWAPATSSNYSIKVGNPSEIWISRSGVDKGSFEKKHLMKVDNNGKTLVPIQAKPSAETGIHTMLYKRPNIGCILHTHTIFNTLISKEHLQHHYITIEGYEMQKAMKGEVTHENNIRIPIFANSQDIATLAQEVEKHLDNSGPISAFLLAGHGLYAWGETVSEAKRHIEALEFLFECIVIGKIYGNIINS